MRLLSVNVGQPRAVRWRGREVRSAIWKEPVAGRRRVGGLNVEGDAQADLVGHGGEHRAVFVYQLESYRHWERELGRPLRSFGQFGENFTVEGLADADVRVGDRLAIGSALFEVTQPRVTCFKVGIRLDEPQMPALLTGHGRPGFYLRVLRTGEVAAGDPIAHHAEGPPELTIERVSALLYTPDFDEHALRLALATPALPDGWKASFAALLEQRARGGAGNRGLSPLGGGPPAYPGWRRHRVAEAVAETRGVRSLVLVPADGRPPAPHRPGQFVTVRVQDAASGTALVRSYSLSAAADGRSVRISVKRAGAASALLHDAIDVGDELEVGAPRGDFTLADGGTAAVVLISAGIGITPVLAMLEALAEACSDRPVTWVHVARAGDEHAFAQASCDLLRRLPGARAHVRYTRPAEADRAGTDFDAVGRPALTDVAGLRLGRDAEAYVCGPAGFMRDMTDQLLELGLEPARVHTEAFGAVAGGARPPHPPDGPVATGPQVSFARSGVAAAFDPRRWTSLLELAEACDVPVGWSCRTGVCHRCESGLVAGAVAYDPEPLDRPSPGVTLLCCARPHGDVVLDL